MPEDDPKRHGMEELMVDPAWEDKLYPCVLHADAGTYTKKTAASALVASVKSLLSDAFDSNIVPGFVLPQGIRVAKGDDSFDGTFERDLADVYSPT